MNFIFIIRSPGVVILIMVGGLQYGWKTDETLVLVFLLIITFGYGLLCLYASQDLQLMTARVLTLVFSLIMSVAFIGVLMSLVSNPEGEPKLTKKPGIATDQIYEGKLRPPPPVHICARMPYDRDIEIDPMLVVVNF